MLKKLLLFAFIGTQVVFGVGIGDKAPDFTLQKLSGDSISLSDYQGKIVYIFWFGWG